MVDAPLCGDQRVPRIARGTAATYCTEPVEPRALPRRSRPSGADDGRAPPSAAERGNARQRVTVVPRPPRREVRAIVVRH